MLIYVAWVRNGHDGLGYHGARSEQVSGETFLAGNSNL